MTLRIGSLFTGTGALDLAVMDVFDAVVVWHSQYEPPDKNGKEDTNQYAAQILARHWPTVPNLGDITKVDWQAVIQEHGPVDILTGGFPCTDVSSAGKRAGLTPDTRSGLWTHMAYAISILNPRLVIIENVEGLLSAPADRGLGLDAEALEEEARAGRILRALGAVLGDLASLRFHAEWARVGADEVEAPHRRRRIIIYAWPADADPADLGHERCREARRRGHGSADSRVAAADAQGAGRQGERVRGQSAERGRVVADADGWGREGNQERDRGPKGGQPERERGLDAVGRGVRGEAVEPVCPTCGCEESFHDGGGFCAGCGSCADPELGRPDEAPADAQRIGWNERRPEPAREQGRPDAAERGGTAPSDTARHSGRLGHGDDVQPGGGTDGREPTAGGGAPANTDGFGGREAFLNLRPGQPDLDWGDYEPAIRRWEAVLGRPAPWPADALGRLSPVFTEWMMGLPDGWVTDTPGLTRPAMLRALGNGVVWQQAAAAIRLLHARAIEDSDQTGHHSTPARVGAA